MGSATHHEHLCVKIGYAVGGYSAIQQLLQIGRAGLAAPDGAFTGSRIDRTQIISSFSPLFSTFSTLQSYVASVPSGGRRVKSRANESQPSDRDLLTERQARDQELPMSLAWFRRKRLLDDGPPFIRISNRIFYCRGELRRWIAKHRA
jgi:hypothetical protein